MWYNKTFSSNVDFDSFNFQVHSPGTLYSEFDTFQLLRNNGSQSYKCGAADRPHKHVFIASFVTWRLHFGNKSLLLSSDLHVNCHLLWVKIASHFTLWMFDRPSKSSHGHSLLHIEFTHEAPVAFIIIIAGLLSVGSLLSWCRIVLILTAPRAHENLCIAAFRLKIMMLRILFWQVYDDIFWLNVASSLQLPTVAYSMSFSCEPSSRDRHYLSEWKAINQSFISLYSIFLPTRLNFEWLNWPRDLGCDV